MRVALVGPPQSGKSVLFAAIAEAGGSHVDTHRADQEHLAVVKVLDDRLAWLSELNSSKKITSAEVEFLDVPCLNLADESGRSAAQKRWSAIRQSDMLVYVVRAFTDESVPAYRGRINPQGDLEELVTEIVFADLDQVTARMKKLEAAICKPTPRRDEQQRELELMKHLAEALEADKPIAQTVASPAQAKLLRSFAFLSEKPALAVLNCSEGELDQDGPSQLGPLPCITLSAKIEEEIAQLTPEDRQEFLADLHLSAVARDRLIRACYERMNLISFLTSAPQETRAWSVPAGTDALTAAAEVHTDMARGFIRAETVGYDDLRAAGDMKAAKAAGKVRLEGKNYIVQDGDVIYFRFNV